MLSERSLDNAERESILATFHEADLSIIKSIIYFDGWSDYEECGGYLIFRGIDESIQVVDYGYSVMAEDNTNYFIPREVSEDTAQRLIKEMEKAIKEQPDMF